MIKFDKESLIKLWHDFLKIPTSNLDGTDVIDKGFLIWHIGSDKSEILNWFDRQYAEWGGLLHLAHDDPSTGQTIYLDTPAGILECYVSEENGKTGIQIVLNHTDAQKMGEKSSDDLVCRVEFDPQKNQLQIIPNTTPGQRHSLSEAFGAVNQAVLPVKTPESKCNRCREGIACGCTTESCNHFVGFDLNELDQFCQTEYGEGTIVHCKYFPEEDMFQQVRMGGLTGPNGEYVRYWWFLQRLRKRFGGTACIELWPFPWEPEPYEEGDLL